MDSPATVRSGKWLAGEKRGGGMPRLAQVAELERPPEATKPAHAEKDIARPLRYFAFLSYSHRDQAIAEWLHDQLEQFRVPKTLAGQVTENGAIPGRLTPIFRDRRELAASDDLGSEIRDAIGASRFMVVLCSPAAAQSRWTNAEVEAFKRLRPEGCILAAIVDGEPFASDISGRAKHECLPHALRVQYDKRGRPTARRAEPLAADLREDGDGRRIGFLKIVAGMLGVGLDELVQRDTLRRQRRMAVLAAISLGGMIVTSTLAVTAIQARDAASDQRREAESLVGFMLGDLRDKLEPIGRLDALDAVGSRALGYFEKQDKGSLSDAALAQRSQALALLAQIATARGDTAGALRRYSEALAGTAEMIRRAPDDPQRLFDHAQNVFYVGELERGQGRLDAAEARMRQYKALADRMVALQPDNVKWRMEEKYADGNLGIILYTQRRYGEASRQLQQSLRTLESLASADPRNEDYQKSIVETLAWVSDSQLGEGRIDEATATRERQAALVDSLMRQHPADVAYRVLAIPAHRALARLLMFKGDIEPALDHARRSVSIGVQLLPTEPDNAEWIARTAGAQIDYGGLLQSARQSDEAAAQVRAGCELSDRLSSSAGAAGWRKVEYDCLMQRGRLALGNNSAAEAEAIGERAVAQARKLHSGDRAEDRLSVVRALKLVGDARAASGDQAGAARIRQAAFRAWPGGIALRPQDLATQELMLEQIGRTEAAAAVRSKLDSIGYREPGYIHQRTEPRTAPRG